MITLYGPPYMLFSAMADLYVAQLDDSGTAEPEVRTLDGQTLNLAVGVVVREQLRLVE